MARKQSADLPSRKQILDFVASSDQPAGKREIARAFGIRGDSKIALKKLLNDMADEGLIEASRGRAFNQVGGVPRVTVLKIVETDDSGSVFGQPEHWEADTPPPKLRIIEKERRGALGIGDRVLARTEERGDKLVAHPLKKLAKKQELVLGVLRQEGTRFWLTPVEKKERLELPVSDVADGEAGDLVLCEVSGRGPRVTARVDAVLGDPFAPKSFSLIAIHKYELPHEFGDAAIAEAKRVAKQPLKSSPERGGGRRVSG
jgi:ribonuclease R